MPSEIRASEQLQQYLRLLVVIAAPVCGKKENEPLSQPLDVWGEWRRFAQAKKDWPTALAYFTRSRDLYQQIGLEKKVQEKEALIAAVQEQIQG